MGPSLRGDTALRADPLLRHGREHSAAQNESPDRGESLRRISNVLVLSIVGLWAGAWIGVSCTVDYPTVAFRCNPQQADNCPQTHFCCSDDPSAEGGGLPAFIGQDISGAQAPYFAGSNNALGTQGMCVRTEDLSGAAALAEPAAAGCPIPCNPTWAADEIATVCGASRQCCQTVPLEPADCVLDDGVWRAVRGSDIGETTESGTPVTTWLPADHATHQDPRGNACLRIAMNDAESEVFADCVGQLSVADQRGFCLGLGADQACPTADPTFTDACAALNEAGG